MPPSRVLIVTAINSIRNGEPRLNSSQSVCPLQPTGSACDTRFDVLQFDNVKDSAAHKSFGDPVWIGIDPDVHGVLLDNRRVVVRDIVVTAIAKMDSERTKRIRRHELPYLSCRYHELTLSSLRALFNCVVHCSQENALYAFATTGFFLVTVAGGLLSVSGL